jgi:hypothetical protein
LDWIVRDGLFSARVPRVAMKRDLSILRVSFPSFSRVLIDRAQLIGLFHASAEQIKSDASVIRGRISSP